MEPVVLALVVALLVSPVALMALIGHLIGKYAEWEERRDARQAPLR